ncbi:hypothetical protein OIE50_48270 [Streptomyces canus]|uniref:hypothetical protein n=1 Tax=Streptomyces canus TaxID=58343 RepID=UPI0032438954
MDERIPPRGGSLGEAARRDITEAAVLAPTGELPSGTVRNLAPGLREGPRRRIAGGVRLQADTERPWRRTSRSTLSDLATASAPAWGR